MQAREELGGVLVAGEKESGDEDEGAALGDRVDD